MIVDEEYSRAHGQSLSRQKLPRELVILGNADAAPGAEEGGETRSLVKFGTKRQERARRCSAS
jgi:hypothetical protein